MSASTVFNVPLRADLANVQPIFYPIIEQRRFGSIKAMCTRMGWPLALVGEFVKRAQIERSGPVVVDRLVLGDPDKKMLAVLVLQPGGAVILCAGLFNETTEDHAEAKALLDDFAASPEFKGKFLAIGEFRPNPRGGMQ